MSISVSPSKFAEAAYGVTSIEDLPALKTMKNKLCHMKGCSREACCFKCNKIRRRMCKLYHVDNPAVELCRRLVFEYIFEYITFKQLADDTWMKQCQRDTAHHARIIALLDKVRNM